METHDEDGVPYVSEIQEMLEPRPWEERATAEFGSLMDRTGLAYNRESYFR